MILRFHLPILLYTPLLLYVEGYFVSSSIIAISEALALRALSGRQGVLDGYYAFRKLL